MTNITKQRQKGVVNPTVVIIVTIVLILILLIIPVIQISIIIGMIKKYGDVACNWKFALNIILTQKQEKSLKEICQAFGGGDSGGGIYDQCFDYGIGIDGGGGKCNGGKITGINSKYSDYLDDINNAAKVYMGGDSAALIALIQVESGFNIGADNPKSTALGFGQFLDSTAKKMKEFTGGNDGKTNIEWPHGEINNTANDARLDPKRSIYAAAHYDTTSDKTTAKECSGKIGAERWACFYKWNHHRGCRPGNKTGPGTDACTEAEEGSQRVKNIYKNIISSGTCEIKQDSSFASSNTSSNIPAGSPTESGLAILEQAKKKLKTEYKNWGRDGLEVVRANGTKY